MARNPAYTAKPHGRRHDHRIPARRVLALATAIGIAGSLAATFAEGDTVRAAEAIGGRELEGLDTLDGGPLLDAVRRLPPSLEPSLQLIGGLSANDICRVGEILMQEPNARHVDAVARYLAMDVRRWSDRMLSLYFSLDPPSARAMNQAQIERQVLHRWQIERQQIHHWLQGCGLAVRVSIRRGRPAVVREAAAVLTDVISAIAAGMAKSEPDAVVAARALLRTERTLRLALRQAVDHSTLP